MSTLYNRRRGEKANGMRKPRVCENGAGYPLDIYGQPCDGLDVNRCIRLAFGTSRYCQEHQS